MRTITGLALLLSWMAAGCGSGTADGGHSDGHVDAGNEDGDVDGDATDPPDALPGQCTPIDPDADSDGDGIPNSEDNCDCARNLEQFDRDDNGIGDECDRAGPSDEDEDGIDHALDNCDSVPNPDQEDSDGDLSGDACDNCPEAANYDQADTNSNRIGDVCEVPLDLDADDDGDGVDNGDDNCFRMANADQADGDGDGRGDVCDNCVAIANFDQADSDLDGVGNACPDDDGDGVSDARDVCPMVADVLQTDADGDARGDACDNCPSTANYDQADADDDEVGDACEAGPSSDDSDGDMVPNASDNCRAIANPAQEDTDGDRVGNACDNCAAVANFDQADADDNDIGDACDGVVLTSDDDGDGVSNSADNCRTLANADQADSDSDRVGNACDNCPTTANFRQDDLNDNDVGDACEVVEDDTPFCAETTLEGSRVPPNLYFLLDHSSSMRTTDDMDDDRWTRLTIALDAIAPSITANANVGLASYPDAAQCGSNNPRELLDLRPGNTEAQFMSSYNDLGRPPESFSEDAHYTPTSQALDGVRTRGLMNFASDSIPTRGKAVVLITDGAPNCHYQRRVRSDITTYVPPSVDAAAALFDADVPVYVLGFAGTNEDAMEDIAEGGGTDNPGDPDRRWFPVSSTDEIIDALESIARSVVSCDVAVTFTPDSDRTRMRVVLENRTDTTETEIAPSASNGWTLETTGGSAGLVHLHGTACTGLLAAVASGDTVGVNVKVACSTCVSSPEMCDGLDNDCDDVPDDGLMCTTTCMPELCDGVDNDCDGVDDNGCPEDEIPPACMPSAETCDGDDNDCDGSTDEGCPSGTTPMPGCAPVPGNEVCGNDFDDDCDGMTNEGCPPETPMCMPFMEQCNGRDDDCDDMTDEGCTSMCTPSPEVCNGADDDCDGMSDDGCPPVII